LTIVAIAAPPAGLQNDGEKKLFWLQRFAMGSEMVRSLIDHRKVLVLALNGPAVGGGAAWFQGACDLFYAAEGAWLQITFPQLGLVPEFGSVVNMAQSIGVHKANELFMFGGKVGVEELKSCGLVNQIFPKETFHESVHKHLKKMLMERSGKSMMEVKRLQNAGLRDQRIVALFNACDALAERFVDGEPIGRMRAKMEELKSMLASA